MKTLTKLLFEMTTSQTFEFIKSNLYDAAIGEARKRANKKNSYDSGSELYRIIKEIESILQKLNAEASEMAREV